MFNIPISKSGLSLQVDFDSMPKNAQDHIIAYGLKQKLNDAGSSATIKELGADDAALQAQAMAENVLAELMKGNVTVRQAASAKTLEERKFTAILNRNYKKAFKAKAEDMDDNQLLAALSVKLGEPEEKLRAGAEARAKVEADLDRKIAALKAAIPPIES